MNNQDHFEKIQADYHLFIDIQTKKYLVKKNKNEFTSKKEAKDIIDIIIAVWNESITNEKEKLDSLDTSGKAAWFNSININFDQAINSEMPAGEIKDPKELVEEIEAYYDELFPFLPEGGFKFLIFAGPAFEAFGYPIERYKKLITGEERPTEIEEDLLLWAYNLSFGVTAACKEKDKNKKNGLLLKTIEYAEEYLDKETAMDVTAEIYTEVKNSIDDLLKRTNRKKSHKNKRK